jgi:hypothetical protein
MEVLVVSLSGDSVSNDVLREASAKVNEYMKHGSTSGEFEFTRNYVATGHNETAHYTVTWKVTGR